MLKNLEVEENMVEQTRSNIKNPNKKIIEMQNSSTHFPNIFNKTIAITARSATTTV